MKRGNLLFNICVVLAALNTAALAEEFCVTDSASLQRALSEAAVNAQGDVIRLVQGVYVPPTPYPFVYGNQLDATDLAMVGGYEAGCLSRSDSALSTIDGQRAGHTALAISAPGQTSTFVLENLAVMNAGSSSGESVYLGSNGTINLRGMLFERNAGSLLIARNTRELNIEVSAFIENDVNGYVLETWANDTRVEDTVFEANTGVSLYYQNFDRTGNLILRGNSFARNGGGVGSIAYLPADFLVERNRFFQNGSASGMPNLWIRTGGNVRVRNNLFLSIDNQGGGCFVQSGTLTIAGPQQGCWSGMTDRAAVIEVSNNTFLGNKARDVGAVNVQADAGDTALVLNNSFYGNSGSAADNVRLELDGDSNFVGASATVQNNAYTKETPLFVSDLPVGVVAGNIDADDLGLRVDAQANVRLEVGSILIDRGTSRTGVATQKDVMGNDRDQGPRPDIGAYESPAHAGLVALDSMSDAGPEVVAAVFWDTRLVRQLSHAVNSRTGSHLEEIPLTRESVKDQAVVGDLNGNGSDDLAVLQVSGSGRVEVRVKDGTSGETLLTIPLLALSHAYWLEVLPDTGPNGSPELAVLGIGSGGAVLAEVRDAWSGATVSTLDFDSGYQPYGFAAIEDDLDNNGFPELAVLGVRESGSVRAEVKDLISGQPVAIVAFDAAYRPAHVTAVDLDGNGRADALAVLGRTETDERAEVRDLATGGLVSTVGFGSAYSTHALRALTDIDNSGTPELLVLQTDAAGASRARIVDAVTGTSIGTVAFDGDEEPRDLLALPDQDNDGAPELAYLGEGPTGQYRLQVKAALTGSALVSKTLGEGFPDADEDGLPDTWELQYGLNTADPADAASDLDVDGLSARQEYHAGTHPNQADTDSDGINDGQDTFPADASETADADGDGWGDRADAFPADRFENLDTDADGTGNNADSDDDNDGVPDVLDYHPRGRFSDARPNHWAFRYIEALAASGITAGCSKDKFCPSAAVSRAQMAVFLERGMRGSAFVPPPATGTVFADVPTNAFAASFIEQLRRDAITAGCGSNNYCPAATVTREQMAVFLLRAKHGAAYSPPPVTGLFADVPASHWAARWIEQLAREGITGGCGGGNYCPSGVVTRDQMAVFLVRTFGL